jgi:hypothetical protein
MIVICIFCISAVSFYSETSQVISENPSEQNSDIYGNNDYKIFRDKKGFYGVSDLNGNQIVLPQWNSIKAVSNEYFIVSRIIDNAEVFGMIDREENIITPLAYSSLELAGRNVVAGKPQNSNEYIILRNNGTLYVDETWDSFSISGNEIILSKNRSKYYTVISDDRLEFISFELVRAVSGKPFTFTADFSNYSGNISYKDINEMADKSVKYIEALSADDKSALRDTTSFEYYTDIIISEYLGKSVNKVSDAVINAERVDKITIYSVNMKVNYVFAAETSESLYTTAYDEMNSAVETEEYSETEKSVEFIISFEKSSDGSMIINSVYYSDIQ